MWFNALSLGGTGEYEQALNLLQQLLTYVERIDDGVAISRVLNSVGWIYGELQDHQQAMKWNRRGVKYAQEAGFPDPEVESNARLNLADNLLALGRLQEAEEHYQVVERIIRNSRQNVDYAVWRYSQHHFHSYGELWLMRGELEKALAYAAKCLVLADESNSRKNIVKGRRLRGQALMAQGHLDQAEEELSIALDMAQKVGNPAQLWQTHAALGDLQTLQVRYDGADEAYQDAVEVIQQVAGKLTDPDLRETFLTSTTVRTIVDKSKRAK